MFTGAPGVPNDTALDWTTTEHPVTPPSTNTVTPVVVQVARSPATTPVSVIVKLAPGYMTNVAGRNESRYATAPPRLALVLAVRFPVAPAAAMTSYATSDVDFGLLPALLVSWAAMVIAPG